MGSAAPTWELQAPGALSFAELRERCDGMSPSVLNQRLTELREADVVTLRDQGGYVVTADGRSLCATLASLQHWAERWAQRGRAAARPARALRPPPLSFGVREQSRLGGGTLV